MHGIRIENADDVLSRGLHGAGNCTDGEFVRHIGAGAFDANPAEPARENGDPALFERQCAGGMSAQRVTTGGQLTVFSQQKIHHSLQIYMLGFARQ